MLTLSILSNFIGLLHSLFWIELKPSVGVKGFLNGRNHILGDIIQHYIYMLLQDLLRPCLQFVDSINRNQKHITCTQKRDVPTSNAYLLYFFYKTEMH